MGWKLENDGTMESAIFAVFADYSAIFNDGYDGWKFRTMETMERAIFAVFADYSAIFNDGYDGMEARKRWRRWKARFSLFSLFSLIIALFSLKTAHIGPTGAEQRSTGPYFHSVCSIFAENDTNCAVLSICKQRTK
jgi:hypothetical protein